MLVELVKAIFEYGLPGAAILLALVAVWIVRDALRTQKEIVAWIKEREAADAEADEHRETRLAEERKAMFDLFESILARSHERYADLVTTIQTNVADLSQTYKQGMAEIVTIFTTTFQRAETTMAQVGVDRAARFDRIDTRFDALDTALVDVNTAQTQTLLDTLHKIELDFTVRADAIEALLKDHSCAQEVGTLLALLQEKLAAVHAAVNDLIALSKAGRGQTPAPESDTKSEPTMEESHDRVSQSSGGRAGSAGGADR